MEIKPIGSGEDSAGSKRPAVTIIAPLLQGRSGKVFTSWIVVDDGDGPLGAGEAVVGVFIVLGIGQMDLGALAMMVKDLFLVGNEVMAFQGIAGEGGAGHRQLDAQAPTRWRYR